ncbi:MAG: MFS transporter [Deltaproteobacteria bacterium]|nr:MFS transporter [Deltaproteobacteria bacterium]
MNSRINSGWWGVFAGFLTLVVFSGCGYFFFSLFVKPLEAHFGWDRSTIMAAFTFLFMAVAVASPIAGKAVDRYSPKQVMTIGALVMGSGFFLLSLMSSPLVCYVGHVIVGAGSSALGPIPLTAVVSGWFIRNRGLAIGIMATGTGAGGIIMAPLIGGFLIPRYGWSASYVIMGVLTCVVVIPMALFLIKKRPMEKNHGSGGGLDDGDNAGSQTALDLRGLPLKRALLTPAFWLIAMAFVASQIGLTGAIQSQVPHLQDIGFPVGTAAAALGGIALVSGLAKIMFGWLCDFIKPKYVFNLAVLFMAGGTFILMNVKPDSGNSILWLYALIMGIGAGSWLPTMSMLVSENFGLAAYGSIFGALSLVFNMGVSVGPLLAGFIFDVTNGYHWAFVTFMISYAVAIPVMFAAVKPKVK